MAYSSQTEHGQNERKARVLSAIANESSKERPKFVPNPAAKPFVPTSNLISNTSCWNKTWTAGQGQHTKYGHFAAIGYMNGPYVNGVLEHHSVNGVSQDEPGTPTTPQPNEHIALHLLSKVLDDESVVNFTNFDESTAGIEPFSFPGAVPMGQGFDGNSHSWHSAAPVKGPTPSTMPIGSFPGQNIWSSGTDPNSTPPLSPLELSPPSSLNSSSLGTTPPFPHPSSLPPNSLDSPDGASPIVNGYHDDISPHPSPNGQTFGSCESSPHSFVPIKEPLFSKGKSWQSEHSYLSNSGGGSFPQGRPSPTSHLPLSHESRPTSLNFTNGNGYRYNSSPSMSPSSPPSTYSQSDPKHFGMYKRSSSRDSTGQSPTGKEMNYKENGYSSHAMSPRMRSPLTSELHLRLEECYEQLRLLERDRKKAESEISNLWSGRRLSNAGNCVNLRLPANPSRVDKLIVDQFREHAKVEALVGRIERIRHSPLHVSISESVDQWQSAIRDLQIKRKEEVSNSSGGRHRLSCSPRYQDGTDLIALVTAVKNLHHNMRIVRTTVWCAVQLVTAKTVPKSGSFHSEDGTPGSPRENEVDCANTS